LDRRVKRPRRALRTLAGLITEAGVVYRYVKAGKIPHDEGRSLVWILSQMRAMLEAQELERLEAKLDELGAQALRIGGSNGHAITGGQARLPY